VVSTVRDFQSAAVDSLCSCLAQGHRASCFVLPTGAGKTKITFYLIRFKAMEADEAQRCEVDRDLQRVHGCDSEMHEVWQLFSALQAIAARYGYQTGWVAHKYRASLGVWPYATKPVETSLKNHAWVEPQNIRFAKRQEARS